MGETELGETKVGGNYPANVELALTKVSSHCKPTKLAFILYCLHSKKFWGNGFGETELGDTKVGETITTQGGYAYRGLASATNRNKFG